MGRSMKYRYIKKQRLVGINTFFCRLIKCCLDRLRKLRSFLKILQKPRRPIVIHCHCLILQTSGTRTQENTMEREFFHGIFFSLSVLFFFLRHQKCLRWYIEVCYFFDRLKTEAVMPRMLMQRPGPIYEIQMH